jgi:hypothetical protein
MTAPYPTSVNDYGNGIYRTPDLDSRYAQVSSLSDVLRRSVATTEELEDITDSINTSGKFIGKMVFNTTDSVPVWASGVDDSDDWVDSAGAVAHTPIAEEEPPEGEPE